LLKYDVLLHDPLSEELGYFMISKWSIGSELTTHPVGWIGRWVVHAAIKTVEVEPLQLVK